MHQGAIRFIGGRKLRRTRWEWLLMAWYSYQVSRNSV